MWISVVLSLFTVCHQALVVFSTDYEYSYYGDDYMNGDYPRDWAAMVGRIPRPKCIDIPENLSLCQNIGYDRMRLPNLLDHDSLSEVTQQASSWVPLLGIYCHPDTKLFLCSLFSPVCLDRPIYPCRSLCESVKQSCLGRMKAYGFDWPEMLRCEKFPVDNDLCIKQQHHTKACGKGSCKNADNSSGNFLDNNCTACKQPSTYEAIIDNFCQADFVFRGTVEELRPHLGHTALMMKRKKKFYKKNGVTKKDRKRLNPLIENGAHCQCDIANTTKSKYLIMGNKKDHNFMLSFIVPWQKKNKPFKLSLRAIKKKKDDLCKDIFHRISAGNTNKSEKRSSGKRGTKTKKGRRKRKKKDKKNRKRKNKDRKRKKGGNKGNNKGMNRNSRRRGRKNARKTENKKASISQAVTTT